MLSDPGGGGDQFARGSSLDQLQILLNGAVGVCVHVHARKVAVHQWDQAGENTLLVRKHTSANSFSRLIYYHHLSIDDFAEGH